MDQSPPSVGRRPTWKEQRRLLELLRARPEARLLRRRQQDAYRHLAFVAMMDLMGRAPFQRMPYEQMIWTRARCLCALGLFAEHGFYLKGLYLWDVEDVEDDAPSRIE